MYRTLYATVVVYTFFFHERTKPFQRYITFRSKDKLLTNVSRLKSTNCLTHLHVLKLYTHRKKKSENHKYGVINTVCCHLWVRAQGQVKIVVRTMKFQICYEKIWDAGKAVLRGKFIWHISTL
jgi:hypothetical protein